MGYNHLQIVRVVRMLPYHASKHTTQAPQIERVIIILEIHQQLWALEIPALNQLVHQPVQQKRAPEVNLTAVPIATSEIRRKKPYWRIAPVARPCTPQTSLTLLLWLGSFHLAISKTSSNKTSETVSVFDYHLPQIELSHWKLFTLYSQLYSRAHMRLRRVLRKFASPKEGWE